jgi:hypothetical protein
VAADPDYFKRLVKGQKPEFLFIGCSDSRVPAQEIMVSDDATTNITSRLTQISPSQSHRQGHSRPSPPRGALFPYPPGVFY